MSQVFFITLEGLEGVPTKAQAFQLSKWLVSCGVHAKFADLPAIFQRNTTEPDPMARFLYEAAALYEFARQEFAKPISSEGVFITCNYFYHQWAYALARDVPQIWSTQILEKLMKPDMAILFDTCPQKSVELFPKPSNPEIAEHFRRTKLLEQERAYIAYISFIAEEPARFAMINGECDDRDLQYQLQILLKQRIPALSSNGPR